MSQAQRTTSLQYIMKGMQLSLYCSDPSHLGSSHSHTSVILFVIFLERECMVIMLFHKICGNSWPSPYP